MHPTFLPRQSAPVWRRRIRVFDHHDGIELRSDAGRIFIAGDAAYSHPRPAEMTLAVLMQRFPVLWSAQRSELLHPANPPSQFI
jgi:hypothetical protein